MAITSTSLFYGNQPIIYSPYDVSDEWVRPADWIPMPTLSPTDEKFCGILRVVDCSSNYVALCAAGSAGYTVDWGDGTIENINSGVKAEHKYTYAPIPLSATHTVVEGISAKAVLVTVTPQAGVNLTMFNLQARHSRYTSWPTNRYPVAMWLDISLNGPNLNKIVISGTSSTEVVLPTLLERATIGTIGTITSCAYMFNACYALKSVNLFDTSNVSAFNNMFADCYSLKSVPLFDMSNATTVSSMFYGCYSLKALPPFNFAKVTTMTGFCTYCVSLQSVPWLNTSKVIGMKGLFELCYSLESVPLFDTRKVTDMRNMFRWTRAISSLPTFVLSAPTSNVETAFYGMQNLIEIPWFDTSRWTSFLNMFDTCTSLRTIPLYNTANVTTFQNAFNNCYSLETIPTLPMGKATTFTNIFNGCRSLHTLKLNVSAGTTFTGAFNGLQSLKSVTLSGLTRGVYIDDTLLERTAIVNFFNSLGTASGTQMISLTGAPGIADLTADDQKIATDKGFTLRLT